MICELLLKTFIPVSSIFDNEDDIFIFSRNVQKSSTSENYFWKKSKILRNNNYIRMRRKIIDDYLTTVCNIWMICLRSELNVASFRISSVWVFFNSFLLIYAKDRSKNSSDQKRFFITLSLYTLSFFANTTFYFSFVLNSSCVHSSSYVLTSS